MKILLKSGTFLTEPLEKRELWKKIMIGPDQIVTYSTAEDGLIIFRSSDIVEIRVAKEEVEAP